MRILNSLLVAAGLALGALACPCAEAQTARSGGAANAELLQEMQQLASERTSLQADNARLKQQLADLTKERDALKTGQQGVEQRSRAAAAALAQSNSQREATDQELAHTKAGMQELIAKFRETVQTLRQIEADGTAAKQNLAARDRELKVCTERNLALYQLNGEILTHMEHESAWSRLARVEPFTQIARTRLENLADDYKGRAEDQRVNPGPVPAKPASPK